MDRKEIRNATIEELAQRVEELYGIIKSFENHEAKVCKEMVESNYTNENYEVEIDYCEYNKQLCRVEIEYINKRMAKIRAKQNKFKKFVFNKDKTQTKTESEQEKQ